MAHRTLYETRGSGGAFERGLQYARLVVQAEDVQGANDAAARDRYMAENVVWQLDHLPAGSRMMLWAHNGHVQRNGASMGAHLSRFGDDLVVLGFDFYAGSFNAVTYISSGSYGALTTHFISSSPPAATRNPDDGVEAVAVPLRLDTQPGCSAPAPVPCWAGGEPGRSLRGWTGARSAIRALVP